MRFKFTGTTEEVFPSILTPAGTWVAQPGDVIELASNPDHARLEATNAKHTVTGSVVGAAPSTPSQED